MTWWKMPWCAAKSKKSAPTAVPLPNSKPWPTYLESIKVRLRNPVVLRGIRLVTQSVACGGFLLTGNVSQDALLGRDQALLETLASHLLLHGNGYVQVMKDASGQPIELFALRPERMSVIAGSDGWPTGFTYRVGEQSLTIPLIDEDASPNLIHIKDSHPADDHYGFGCWEALENCENLEAQSVALGVPWHLIWENEKPSSRQDDWEFFQKTTVQPLARLIASGLQRGLAHWFPDSPIVLATERGQP